MKRERKSDSWVFSLTGTEENQDIIKLQAMGCATKTACNLKNVTITDNLKFDTSCVNGSPLLRPILSVLTSLFLMKALLWSFGDRHSHDPSHLNTPTTFGDSFTQQRRYKNQWLIENSFFLLSGLGTFHETDLFLVPTHTLSHTPQGAAFYSINNLHS